MHYRHPHADVPWEVVADGVILHLTDQVLSADPEAEHPLANHQAGIEREAVAGRVAELLVHRLGPDPKAHQPAELLGHLGSDLEAVGCEVRGRIVRGIPSLDRAVPLVETGRRPARLGLADTATDSHPFLQT